MWWKSFCLPCRVSNAYLSMWQRQQCAQVDSNQSSITVPLCGGSLKGHGNEADFLGFLQKSVRRRLLTLHFETFQFGLRIRGDIRNRKTTPRLAESGSRQECLKIKKFSNL
jgi:hypothetical protein